MKILMTSLIAVLICCSKLSIAQDTIIKKDNEIIIAKIIEIAPDEIKFSRFDNPNGPVYKINKEVISRIKYSNGLVDEFTNGKMISSNPQKPSEPIDMSPRYILTMNDGSQLRGKIVSETATETTFMDNNLGEKKIKKTDIKNLQLAYGEDVQVFTLTDGSIITGKIVNKTGEATVVETKGLGTITLQASQIRSVRPFEDATITEKGKIWFKNPNVTRYLFAPSAFSLKKGEGYYQNIYGAGNAVNYGLTDHFTIGGGLLGPVGAYVNAKYSFELSDVMHASAGVIAGNGFFPIDGNNLGMGLGFGVVTIGNYDNNITVGTGYGFINSGGTTEMTDKPIFVANGMARLGKKFALVTENWFINATGRDVFDAGSHTGSHYDAFFSYAFRYMGERSTLDAGFVNTPSLINQGWYIGIPYIGFVIRFGNYKDN